MHKNFLVIGIIALIILITIIVFYSNQPNKESTCFAGPGLIIRSFSTSTSTIEAGNSSLLTIEVVNEGGAIAKNIHLTLEGLPDWQVDERNKTIPDLENFQTSNQSCQPRSEIISWNISAPSTNARPSYDAAANIAYDYATTSYALIRVATFDYNRSNSVSTGVLASNSTNAPISIFSKAPNSIVTNASFPVYIQFHNEGSGRVIGPAIDTLNVQVSGEGVTCTQGTVRLIQGSDGFLKCDASTVGVTTMKDFNIKVVASYTYSMSVATTITVLPKAV